MDGAVHRWPFSWSNFANNGANAAAKARLSKSQSSFAWYKKEIGITIIHLQNNWKT
jgi:hypothetical protein